MPQNSITSSIEHGKAPNRLVSVGSQFDNICRFSSLPKCNFSLVTTHHLNKRYESSKYRLLGPAPRPYSPVGRPCPLCVHTPDSHGKGCRRASTVLSWRYHDKARTSLVLCSVFPVIRDGSSADRILHLWECGDESRAGICVAARGFRLRLSIYVLRPFKVGLGIQAVIRVSSATVIPAIICPF